MALQGGVQVVLQHPSKNGGHTCRGFTGLANVTPAWFCVTALHPGDAAIASDVGSDIAAGLVSLGPNVVEVDPPCGGNGPMGECHARDTPDCAKVLLPIVGSAQGKSSLTKGWPKPKELGHICPVLGPSANAATLPKSLKVINGVHWTPGDSSAISTILQLGGLLSARPRLFISYLRAESQALAEQLHDHLIQHGFEVFLDRFSVKPGVDFQLRLTEELSRMGTVLVLESPGILKSSWILHEVSFARKHRLGMLGLRLPVGKAVPGIPSDSRMRISLAELDTEGRLIPAKLAAAVALLKVLHARAERARIAYLRTNLSDTLLKNGFKTQGFDAGGIIVAKKSTKEYAFAVRSLPAELADFHAIEGHRDHGRETFVLAPAKHMDWQTRRSLTWMSDETDIGLEDEGDMLKLVRRLP